VNGPDSAGGGPIRLLVPAEVDFVQVVRVAVRILAGRAGCSDDARTRLQAAVGAAFFASLERVGPDAQVSITLEIEATRVAVTVAAPNVPASTHDPHLLGGIADGAALDELGNPQVWVARQAPSS